MLYEITVKTNKRNEFIDITDEINKKINKEEGMCFVYVPHTTAAVTINEGADPDVHRDIVKTLEKIVPYNWDYNHFEGNSDAHIKSSLIGPSEWIIIKNSKLLLGRWQAVYFCEFDGPRTRRVIISVI